MLSSCFHREGGIMPPENQETVTSPDRAPERIDDEAEIARAAQFTVCPGSGKQFRINRMLDGVKPSLLAPGRAGLTPRDQVIWRGDHLTVPAPGDVR
jgi:hypothetical protein